MKPVIGIDGSRLSRKQKTGTETYSDAVIGGLVQDPTPADWRVYLDRYQTDSDRKTWPQGLDARTLIARRFWTHGRLSLEMATRAPALLFVPSHVIPAIHPRSVVTIHDLGYLHLPATHPFRQRHLLDLCTRWNAKVSVKIIVPSNSTRRDLIEHYRTPPDKIVVINHGVDDRFRSPSKEQITRVLEAHRLARPYVLAVGTVHPRKNLPVLARAVARLNSLGREVDLVLVGKPGWMAEEVLQEVLESGIRDELRRLDYVPLSDLPGLYAGATCFVQPSLFEGFGMPVVEAMAAGTAVLCASTSALPEIGGNGAEFFGPFDDQHLSRLIRRLLEDDNYRNELAARGVEHSKRFSWTKCIEDTRNVLLEAVHG